MKYTLKNYQEEAVAELVPLLAGTISLRHYREANNE